MPYSILTDYQKVLSTEELIQLTDINQAEVVNTTVLTEAISYADSLIDSHLAELYDLPLTTTPLLIKQLSVQVTICYLYGFRVDEMPAAKKFMCDTAAETLKKIQSGQVVLNEIKSSAKDLTFSLLDDTDFTITMSSLENY